MDLKDLVTGADLFDTEDFSIVEHRGKQERALNDFIDQLAKLVNKTVINEQRTTENALSTFSNESP